MRKKTPHLLELQIEQDSTNSIRNGPGWLGLVVNFAHNGTQLLQLRHDILRMVFLLIYDLLIFVIVCLVLC